MLSNYAYTQLSAGDEIEVLPPRGEFNTPLDEGNEKQYMCICAGSGITPVLSILGAYHTQYPKQFLTLVYLLTSVWKPYFLNGMREPIRPSSYLP